MRFLAVDAVENEYHQELIWSLWIKASGRAGKTDESFFTTVFKRVEDYPENLSIFYQVRNIYIIRKPIHLLIIFTYINKFNSTPDFVLNILIRTTVRPLIRSNI